MGYLKIDLNKSDIVLDGKNQDKSSKQHDRKKWDLRDENWKSTCDFFRVKNEWFLMNL